MVAALSIGLVGSSASPDRGGRTFASTLRLCAVVNATPLVIAQLGPIYQLLSPWAEMILRVVVGIALVPHGLRNTFGMFAATGVRSHNLTELAQQLDEDG